jgi:hypothetical protein
VIASDDVSVTLDEAIDDLFGADLDAFTGERTRLARELRQEGLRDDALELQHLRKPTVSAWALNQLARRNRRDVDLLLDAGHRLREAQAASLRGEERESFERARTTEREALRRLRKEAERLLRDERGGASPLVLSQIDETLRAAAISEEGRERLARGRFTAPLVPEGFGALAGLVPDVPPARPATRPKRPSAEEKRRQRARIRELEAAAKAAEAEAERLRLAWEAARAEAQSAREAADAAARDDLR